MIRRLLIANRGEIAVRIARAAREAGIVPLGIYSEADADAVHTRAMDDAVCIGPAPATESYLDVARVLAAARELRADALHPGYGFLSERAPFAEAVRAAGLTFVGPTPEAIAAMGDKTEAKRRARAEGVPVVPGYDGDDQSLAALREQADAIGLPLLVKASAGGGGRGMRVVDDLARFDDALAAAKREALAAFGDDRVLLERYVARPRHIEFQILADTHGTTIHLGERECSIQRRHQKIVEEAPSVAVDAALRERMGAAAVRVARAVGYTNAGTVEFLLDEDGAFYFLEMNARLQVEHPVTELAYGIDLVRLQFAIANGERLPLAQSDVRPSTCAIEVRVNAEDPERDYMPASGTITRFERPASVDVRLDSGVETGSEVSIYYDSMLAKLIAYGPDRATAIDRLTHALDGFRIEGVRTNLPLLRAIARDEAFRAGDTTTAFLTERGAALAAASAVETDDAALLAIAALLEDGRAWRVGDVGIPIRLAGSRRTVAVNASRTADGGWRVRGDLDLELRTERRGSHVVVHASGRRLAGDVAASDDELTVRCEGRLDVFRPTPPPSLETSGGSGAGGGVGAIVSPMPGKIVTVAVNAGDAVAERDLLVVLEAMKMEHRIEAPHDGVVKSVSVAAGALVAGGATLVEFV
jgi:3-methylcrotonyl-CoA carboxylase alpha subunit